MQAHASLNDEDWKKTSSKINDLLTQHQRNALVDYLVVNNKNNLRNVDDLYEHYLIDPRIEPCFKTSKLNEAISATQLFIHRILFGLERSIVASEQLRDWWVWMRNYRIWEANRKVFLFPENWLFPELRDDKSSSFTQLESKLGQSELTQELAQQAFGEFLDDVAQMGQIQVLGMYEDVALDDKGSILLEKISLPVKRDLYVIGRTNYPPYSYFWRKCIDFGSLLMEWSPWQRIELDITGDHVILFLINKKPLIIWPIISRSEPDENGESKIEIKFSWSNYNGAQWSQAKTSRDEVSLAKGEVFDERSSIHLEGFTTNRQQSESSVKNTMAVVNVFTRTRESMPVSRNSYDSGELVDFKDRYSLIVKKDCSDNYVKVLPTSLKKANPQLSSQLIINWFCWIRVKFKKTDSNTKLLRLIPSSNREIKLISNRLLMIDDKTTVFGPIAEALGTPISFLCIDSKCPRTKGSQEEEEMHSEIMELKWTVECTFNRLKSKRKFYSKEDNNNQYATKKVLAGSSNTHTMAFEIDASDFTVAELGLEDLIPDRLELSGSFEFNINEIFQNSTYRIKLATPDNTECWLNGYSELMKHQISDFIVKFPVSQLSRKILGPSIKDLSYEVIPAVTTYQVDEETEDKTEVEFFPRIWHYREGQANTYIDVSHEELKLSEKFCLYPSGYSEAFEYSSLWRNSNTIAITENQGGLFDVQLLPLQIENMDRKTIRLKDEPGGGIKINEPKQRELSFNNQFPYACYNWEVFFHAPLMIADQLSRQHKFEDAERWLRYVFDPTANKPGEGAKGALNFRVFRELDLNKQVIDDLTVLAQAAGGFATSADITTIDNLITRWRNMPFRPFVIARQRHIAFLWRTLFAYLDNLIAWADSLYRQDRRESLTEARMLYGLAEKILGRRPQQHQSKSKRKSESFDDMADKWDSFANFWINTVTSTSNTNPKTSFKQFKSSKPLDDRPSTRPRDGENRPYPNPNGMLYFCMPWNDKITGYWRIIDDRLFNLRNCKNIEGIERDLPLTDAPIDPELLVRAVAAGLNLGDVINGLYAPPPHYRYTILSARAAELANEVKALGAAMLSAIEKRDAEEMALLRSSNELSMLKLVQEVRKKQIEEAEVNLNALEATRKTTGARYSQYQRLLGKKDIKIPESNTTASDESMLGNIDGLASTRSNWGLIKEENEQYTGIEGANTWSTASAVAKVASGGFHTAAAAAGANPVAHSVLSAFGHGVSALGDGFSIASQMWRIYAEQQGMMAGHIRRRDEWAFQSNQTLKELQQIDKQILANQIRKDITDKELANHIEQLEQAKATDEVMRSKFSNQQLYQWMVSQLSGLYFNAYRMALDMARSAERAAARELGVQPLNILGNEYWDSLRNGLLAGERLHQDLKRLENSFLEKNRREFELTKHISLRRLNPEALVQLRLKDPKGCEFNIPEWVFDLDNPGHYMRRIKSVSVSIPCVTGPYTSISCKLTLLKSRIRHDRIATETDFAQDNHFTDYFGASEAMVTSTGNADSGMFEPQLRDERFLPFESSGVISKWRLELPADFPQFDYSTISDVILTIRYTARDGGDSLKDVATGSIKSLLNPVTSPLTPSENDPRFPVLFSCRSDFSTEWAQARNTSSNLKIQINNDLLPYWMEAVRLEVLKVETMNLTKDSKNIDFKTDGITKTESIIDLGKVNTADIDRLVLLSMGSEATKSGLDSTD